MEDARVSDKIGRYVPSPVTDYTGFDYPQARYLEEELRRISDAIANLDEGVGLIRYGKFQIVGEDGTTIMNVEPNGGAAVNIQDQTTEIIDLHIAQQVSGLTLTVSAAIDDTQITGDVDVAFTPLVGQVVCLKENTAFYQGEIIAAVNNAGDNWTLTLDTPLDYAFTAAGGCSITSVDLNVDGSVTPQVFKVSPVNLAAGTQWDITRIIISIEGITAMDSGKFGSLTKLTNGVVFRSSDGVTKNLFNAKTNGDLGAHSYDLEYDPKAPAGVYGVRCRSTFAGQSKRGVTIRLAADTADEFQVIIQDDLTTLTKFHVVAQGHVVQ